MLLVIEPSLQLPKDILFEFSLLSSDTQGWGLALCWLNKTRRENGWLLDMEGLYFSDRKGELVDGGLGGDKLEREKRGGNCDWTDKN